MSPEEYKEYRRKVIRESQRKRRALAREQGLCIICLWMRAGQEGWDIVKNCEELTGINMKS